jgi:hypothetical protein
MALANINASNATRVANLLDVVGYNYLEQPADRDHQSYPGRVIYGSENSRSLDAWRHATAGPTHSRYPTATEPNARPRIRWKESVSRPLFAIVISIMQTEGGRLLWIRPPQGSMHPSSFGPVMRGARALSVIHMRR